MRRTGARMNYKLRIIGLISSLGYLIVILTVWMLANIYGYTYFSGGEPNPLIKYPEWVLGTIGVITLIDILKTELDNYIEGHHETT